MGLVSEFKEFIMQGNAVDLAVGVVIGAAFGKIVASLVGDVIMPVVGYFSAGVDFSSIGYTLQEAQGDVPAVMIKYGAFFQTLIDFAIIGFIIFMVVKGINSMKKKEEDAPAEPSAEEVLLGEIRDAIKSK